MTPKQKAKTEKILAFKPENWRKDFAPHFGEKTGQHKWDLRCVLTPRCRICGQELEVVQSLVQLNGCTAYTPLDDLIEVWAFRARKLVKEVLWNEGIYIVSMNVWPELIGHPVCSIHFGYYATPFQWLQASAIAKVLEKGEQK